MKGWRPSSSLVLAATLWVTLGGCGAGSDADNWSSVQACISKKGVLKFDGHAQAGVNAGDDVIPPLDFADAPGGWLIAYVRKGQRLHLFFYTDAGEAARAEDKASKTYEGPVGSRRNVVFAFDEAPDAKESAMVESCLKGAG